MESGLRNSDPGNTIRAVRGWVAGAALGGALGAEVRFADGKDIVRRYGPLGPSEFGTVFGRPGAITSDMQLTLLGIDAMIRAHLRSSWHRGDPVEEIKRSLRRWLLMEQDGWFPGHEELFQRRWADRTTLDAIRTYVDGGEFGTIENPINDSQESSAILRSGVAALWLNSDEHVFHLAARICALTHGHPNAYLSAGAYAVMLQFALHSGHLQRAIMAAEYALERWEHHEPVKAALTAVKDAVNEPGELTPESMAEFGDSTTAIGALAIGTRAANESGFFMKALGPALIVSGDTATTGAIAGSLAGASLGSHALPKDLVDGLELSGPMLTLADLTCEEFGNKPSQDTSFYDSFPYASPRAIDWHKDL